MKRKGYISWDEYFMGVALLAAKRSKDPNTQVGACIVHNNVILSTGYNGFPYGCSDDEYPWEREGDFQNNTKYPFVVHAELNAILNSQGKSLMGATIYVALFSLNSSAPRNPHATPIVSILAFCPVSISVFESPIYKTSSAGKFI